MENIQIQDQSGDKKYFTIIPNYILNHSTLWDREVYIQMKRIAGESGTCWTSQKTLSKQCGMSVNRLKQSIKYLLSHGWIKQVGRKPVGTEGGVQEVNEYLVVDLWKKNLKYYEGVSGNDTPKRKAVSPNDTPARKGVSRKSQRGITDGGKGVSPESYKEEPFINNNPINNNPSAIVPIAGGINSSIDLWKYVSPNTFESFFVNTTERNAQEKLSKKIPAEKFEILLRDILPQLNLMPFVGKDCKAFKPSELLRNLDKILAKIREVNIKSKKEKVNITV